MRPWDNEIKAAIRLTKIRIKFCEKHGIGASAIQEKSILKKQERKLELKKEETGRNV